LAQLVFYTGQASFFLVFALYVQFGRGLDPLGAGLIFIAIGTGYMATSLTARYFAAKLGRQVIAAGGVLRVVGLSLLIVAVSRIGSGGNIGWLVPGLVIDGAGMGLAVAPLATTVLSRMTPQHAGAASGVLNTAVWIGNAIGVAIIGVIFYGQLGSLAGVSGYADAFRGSLFYLLGVGTALAILVQLLPRRPGAQK
jgi:MFS family permease